MYNRLTPNRAIIPEFEEGVLRFLEYARGRDECKRNSNTMKCPCEKCKCKRHWKSSDDVAMDLIHYRFMLDYYVWRCHGEVDVRISTDTRKQLAQGSTSRTPITRTNGVGYRRSFIYSQ